MFFLLQATVSDTDPVSQPEMSLEGPGLHTGGSHDKQVVNSFITVVSESKEIIDLVFCQVGKTSTQFLKITSALMTFC